MEILEIETESRSVAKWTGEGTSVAKWTRGKGASDWWTGDGRYSVLVYNEIQISKSERGGKGQGLQTIE